MWVCSADVNGYLRALTGEDYTAKDFRTWSGTVLAALALHAFEKFDPDAQAKKNIVRTIESVAANGRFAPPVAGEAFTREKSGGARDGLTTAPQPAGFRQKAGNRPGDWRILAVRPTLPRRAP
jgi:hypothetical protein